MRRALPILIAGLLSGAAPGPLFSQAECEVDESKWREFQREEDVVVLVFERHGLPCERLPRWIEDGDPIEIWMILDPDSVGRYTVDLEGKIEDEPVRLLGQEGSRLPLAQVNVRFGEEGKQRPFYFGTFGPFSAPSVTVKVRWTPANDPTATRERSYALRLRRTWIASLRLGVGRAEIRFDDFDVKRVDGDEETVIVNSGGDDGDLRPFVLVAFYAWRFWEKDFWEGRAVEEPREGLWNRIDPVVGVGLKDLWDEYLAGASIEIARGLDLFAARHFARVEELGGGLEVGQPFSGTRSDLPVRRDWEHDWMLGASVDLRIAGAALGRAFGSGS